jgi:hypothetical protein
MSENTAPEPHSAESTQTDLKRLAALLRDADHLDPEAQKSLAALLEELGTELQVAGIASAQAARLAEAVTDVARSLHKQDSAGELETARDNLKEAAIRAEVEAPVATGLAYRFIDLLSSIGI